MVEGSSCFTATGWADGSYDLAAGEACGPALQMGVVVALAAGADHPDLTAAQAGEQKGPYTVGSFEALAAAGEAEGLSPEDLSAQSMADCSPGKWHLGHTSWFFETFVLRDHVPGYVLHDERFPFLFNSYYEALGERVEAQAGELPAAQRLDAVQVDGLHARQFIADNVRRGRALELDFRARIRLVAQAKVRRVSQGWRLTHWRPSARAACRPAFRPSSWKP